LTGGDVQKFAWTADEAKKYGKTFYNKNAQGSEQKNI